MHPLEWIGKIIGRISKEKKKINEIKADSEKRANYTGYGVKSIIFSILAFLTACYILVLEDFSFGENPVFAFLGLLFMIMISYVGPIIFSIYSICYTTIQLTLNRKAISWISLAFTLLSVAGAIFIIVSFATAQ